jgi:hypothetical protein
MDSKKLPTQRATKQEAPALPRSHCGGVFPKHKPHAWSKGEANDVGTMVICPGTNYPGDTSWQ